MSRIRSIHPGLWTDEAFVSLSPFARLLLLGLWNECDDMGSFAWSPLTLKMRILPADGANAGELLDEMVRGGIVLRYEVAGKAFGAVRNFCQYQRPKKANSTFPQTPEVQAWVNLSARQIRDGGESVPNQLPTESEESRQMEDGGGSKEDCSDEQSTAPHSAAQRGGKHFIPKDWKLPPVSSLSPRARACAEQWTDASYQTEGEAFLLYWRTERKMKTDWEATWAQRVIARHSAIMRDQKFGNAPKSGTPTQSPAEQLASLKRMLEIYSQAGRFDDVRETRRRIAELEGGKPPGAVSDLVSTATSGMRVRAA